MQFTPQQMMGYKGFSNGVLIGNWSEDIQVQEDKMHTYQRNKADGKLLNKLVVSPHVPLTPKRKDGFLRFGDVVMVRSEATGAFLAVDTSPKGAPKLNHAMVSCGPNSTPQAHNTWTILRAKDPNGAFYEKFHEQEIVHYGQYIRIVNEAAAVKGVYSLSSRPLAGSDKARSGRQEVTAALGSTFDAVFIIEQADGKQASHPLDGQPVPADAAIIIRHKSTNTPLICDAEHRVGGDFEVAAHLDKAQHNRATTPVLKSNFWSVVTGNGSSEAAPSTATEEASRTLEGTISNGSALLANVRSKILQRGGIQGFRGLFKSLQLLGENASERRFTRRELKEGLELYGVPVTTLELDVVFKTFDRTGDCTVPAVDFLKELRGSMTLHRDDMVRSAFRKLDKGNKGVVTWGYLRTLFESNAEKHPQAVGPNGGKFKQDWIRNFAAGWDLSHDAEVDLEVFVEYYNSISVAISDETAFEELVHFSWGL